MLLTSADVTQRLRQLPGWTFDTDALVRTFAFAGFPDAIAFVGRLAFDAEAADHHPDLHIAYRRVTVRWSTHSEGGVTGRDFDGAAMTNAVAARFLASPPA